MLPNLRLKKHISLDIFGETLIMQLMNAKQYVTGSVKYGFSIAHRKWVFEWCNGRGSYIAPVKGGKATASLIATAISGSVKRNPRTPELDGLCRSRIAQVNHV